MTIFINLLLISILCAPWVSRGLTLDDFTHAKDQSFAARFRRGDAACEVNLAAAPAATRDQLWVIEDWRLRAEALVRDWRGSADRVSYFEASRTSFLEIFDHLVRFKSEFRMPRVKANLVEGAINELRFISAFKGYVSTDAELETLLTNILAQSARLKHEAKYDDADVERFLFDLAILRGQEYMAIFGARAPRDGRAEARRGYRAQRIGVLERNAEKFRDQVKTTP